MKRKTATQRKEHKVFKEWKAGKLHSGSKKGPVVKSRKQAIAIALSEGRRTAHEGGRGRLSAKTLAARRRHQQSENKRIGLPRGNMGRLIRSKRK
jgi:hypothetical protein